MTTGNPDLDILTGTEPEPLTLASGTPVLVERLRTRQMMRLLKILTRGAGSALADLQISAGMNTSEFLGQVLATVVFSIPEAEQEAIDFVRSMVTPAGLIAHPVSKPEHEVNASLLNALDEEMDNPDIEDLISIIERVITVEGPHLAALGNRLALLVRTQQRSAEAKTSSDASKKKSVRSTRAAS